MQNLATRLFIRPALLLLSPFFCHTHTIGRYKKGLFIWAGQARFARLALFCRVPTWYYLHIISILCSYERWANPPCRELAWQRRDFGISELIWSIQTIQHALPGHSACSILLLVVHFKMAAKPKMKYFRWNVDMFKNLINCLSSYQRFMKYRSLDFDAETSTMQVLKDWDG